MKRSLQTGIFLTVFVLAFVLLHFYVLSNLFGLINLHKGIVFVMLIAILSFSYPLASVLERKTPGKLSRALYISTATWLGTLLILLVLTLLYNLISVFISIPNVYAGTSIILLTILLTIYGILHNYHIRTRTLTLYFSKNRLKKDIRLVHLTDVHLGTVNTHSFLEKIVKKTNELKPDVVALTGDLVDGSAPVTLEMLKPIEKIKAPIFFVIGNHEIYDDLKFVIPMLNRTKMKIIRNTVINWKGIQIAGIDFYESSKPAIKALNQIRLNKNKFSILLNHAPIGFETAAKAGFDLQLSGHTHNGQIFPFNFLVKLRYKFLTGLHKINNSYLFVSQGTGTWGPPMRLLTDSEIVVIELKRKD